MTVQAAAKKSFAGYGTYNIGFINSDGCEDETQFDDVESVQELSELFSAFCGENGFRTNLVLYVEQAEN